MNDNAADTAAQTPAPAPAQITVGGRTMPLADAERALRSSASWFWWVAGLSLVNSVATMLEAGYGMILGLGITQIIDALFYLSADGEPEAIGGTARILHLVLVLTVAGAFFAFGTFARRGNAIVYVVGMLAYAIDMLVFVLAQDWIGVGFHAFVLFMLWGGYSMLRAIQAQAPSVVATA